MRRLIIAVDCDDVLVDTAYDLLRFYNQKYATQLDETNFYPTSVDLSTFGVNTLEEVIERFSERFMMPEHHKIAPSRETMEAIRRLAAVHELHLITGRSVLMENATVSMLETYFSGCFKTIEHTNYVTTDKRAEKRTKGEVCKMINADVIIDDYIEHVKNVIDAGIPHAIVYGNFDWGKRGDLPENVVRCKSWGEVEDEIERIARS